MPAADAQTRILKIYFLHTKERAEITYKRNGRYLQSGLKQINHLLRDWRRNEPTNMDPRLLDLLWEVYRQSGSRDYIHVVSAYRSPATNAMLRGRSSGVAEKSQHMLGKAVDFYLPDVKLSRVRDIALRLQAGGVGYYPRSGSPFIHLDVGGVRHWPRLNRQQLAAIFPDGKTLHVPSDGKPLPGYQQALAAYQARQRGGGAIQVADDTSRNRGGRGLLAALFSGGADEAEDDANAGLLVAQRPAANARTARQQAPLQPPVPIQQHAQPQQSPETNEAPSTIIAALPPRSVPVPREAPRPDAVVGAQQLQEPIVAAAGDEETQAEGQAVLASALNVPIPSRRPDHSPTLEDVVAEETDENNMPAIAYVMPTSRPERRATSDVIAELLVAQEDSATPLQTAYASGASMPGMRPKATGSGESGPKKVPSEITPIGAAAEKAEQLAGTAGGEAGSPVAVHKKAERRLDDARAVALLSSSARTAPKSARPRADDVRRDPAPVVVPVEKVTVSTVLSPESVMRSKPVTKAPAFSKELAEAPKAVYTDGFHAPAIKDARRFTGKAVTFLSLAKFDGN